MSVYGFRSGPTLAARSPADDFMAMMDEPMSLGSTFWDQASGGVLESFGLGTTIRELSLPPRATTRRGRGETPENFARRQESVKAITEDEYRSSAYFRDEIPWDAGMTEERAAALAAMYDTRKVREYFAEKRPITSFFGNIAGQALDPINYIPIAGPGVRAAALARYGIVGGRVATAALDAAANTALAGLATREIRRGLGDDVSWQAMVSEIATAAVIGSAFGTVGGVLESRAVRRAAAVQADAERRLAAVGEMQQARSSLGEAVAQVEASAGAPTLREVQEARVALNEAIGGLANDGEVRLSPNGVAPIERMQQETTNSGAQVANGIVVRKLGAETYEAFVDGKKAGELNMSPRGPYATSISVEPEFRKRGVATNLYGFAEGDIGRSMIPSPMGLSDEAIAVWKSRLAKIPAAEKQAILAESLRIGEEAGIGKFARERVDLLGYDPNFKPQSEAVRTGRAAMPERKLLPHDSSLNRTASWVIRDKATGKAVMETFDAGLVEKVNTAKYEAVPIGQYLGEINGQPKRAVDASPARPEPLPTGRAEAEAKVAKAESYKALADQYRVDPETGSFPEESEIRQLQAEGRLTEEDMAVLSDADAAYQDSAAYGEALKSVTGCLL